MANTNQTPPRTAPTKAKSDSSRHGFSRGPFESIPAWVGRIRRQASREAEACGKQLVEEAGRGQSVQELRAKASEIIDLAKTQQRGAWAGVLLAVFPPVLITVDFDGDGGVWINDGAYLTHAGRQFATILHALGNDHVHDGVLEGCEHPLIVFAME